MIRCESCGELSKIPKFPCKRCGKLVCPRDYEKKLGVCWECRQVMFLREYSHEEKDDYAGFGLIFGRQPDIRERA